MIPTDLARALAGRYTLQRELGRGGMAIVYLADDVRHGRAVAVKTMLPDVAAAIGSERFLREIRTAAQLSHPHILPVFDSGEAAGQLYYVTPYVEGESLRDRLQRHAPMPVDEALRVARGVGAAMDYAHRRGVVHRDVKPENILLSDGVALLADFGIARAPGGEAVSESTPTLAAGLTGAGMTLGTPRYMAPEQFERADVDGRADLYALACVLFEMLTGASPFTARTLAEWMRAHLIESPRPVSELRADVSRGVSSALARALAKRPDDRPDTVAAFLALFDDVAAAPAPAATRDHLPAERTSFVGRTRELAAGAELLAAARLVTITGIGGAGKTRLALRLARQSLDAFPDGAWFVDLAPLQSAEHVVPALATALGVREAPGVPLLDAIVEHARDRRLLVVLDNCEHVLAAGAEAVDRLLRDCPLVSILATSREGLGVDGERPLALRSMDVPPAGQPDAAAVAATDAVRLFAERARVVEPGFPLDGETLPIVADICRRLDGIPLAIELAAARTRLLSAAEIRARLDDRFRLLTGGSRTALPRQQTLHATLAWSYDGLSPAEQRLFLRLSVFAGGWTLALAVPVVDAGSEFDVMDGLAGLADKSLVMVEKSPGADSRFGFLETVRQFAAEQLVASGDAERIRRRHADAMIALAESAYRGRIDAEEARAAQLELEHDNFRAALAVARESDPAQFLQLAGALAWFWPLRSHFIEGRAYLTEALAAPASPPPHPDRARALWGLANTLTWQGDEERALPLMEESLAMRRAAGDAAEIATALEGVGWAQLLAGRDREALAVFRELLATYTEAGDPVLINRARVALGQALVAVAELEEARAVSEAILAWSRPRGDRRSEHFALHYLADCDLIAERHAEALERYRKSLRLVWAIGDRLEASFEVQGAAMSLAGLGRLTDGLRLNAAVLAEWRRLGIDPHMRFWDALIERYLGVPTRTPRTAAEREALEAGARLDFADAVSIVLEMGQSG
jgi:predicted ATPase